MTEAAEHSLLSASAAPRWTRCYGSVALESTQPNEGSRFANEGTAAHGLAAFLLTDLPNSEITAELRAQYGGDLDAASWIGAEIVAKGEAFTVDYDFAQHVQRYVDYVRGLGGVQMIETRVNYANWLGVAEELAWGTSDAIVVHSEEPVYTINDQGYTSGSEDTAHTGRLIMTVVDLKFGAGVPVYPNENEQAKLYAGGSLNEIELLIDIRNDDIIRVVIHQPRIGEGAPLEWYVTVGALKAWLKTEAAMAAQHAVKLYEKIQLAAGEYEPEMQVISEMKNDLTPGDKQCKFCNAKAICPALGNLVASTVANTFVDLDALETTLPKTLSARSDTSSLTSVELADKLRCADLIEAWLKAVRQKAEAVLFAGDPLPGFKLVRGKMGSRKWVDEDAAAKVLKRVLGTNDAMTAPSPISPTAAEKFKKAGKISDRQWKSLDANITQSEGGISVAPESDKREAYTPPATADAFTDLEGDDADLAALA